MMIRSNSGSPEVGMSAGLRGVVSELALTTGASAWLNNRPVTLLSRKNEKSATGTNLSERTRGNLRGNFIRKNLQVNDDHDATRYLTHADSERAAPHNSQDF